MARVRPVFDDVVKIIIALEKDHPVRIQDSQSLFGNVHYVIGDTVVDNATFKELSGMVYRFSEHEMGLFRELAQAATNPNSQS